MLTLLNGYVVVSGPSGSSGSKYYIIFIAASIPRAIADTSYLRTGILFTPCGSLRCHAGGLFPMRQFPLPWTNRFTFITTYTRRLFYGLSTVSDIVSIILSLS